jgi:threonine dehydrogenase-like Zn-dependent dehydrogenase
VDISENRLRIAADSCNNIFPINAKKQNPLEVVKEQTQGRGVDIAFEAVGHAVHLDNTPDPVVGCVRAIRGAGTVCALGLSDEPAPLVMKELIWREGKIIASRVSHGEFAEAIDHMQQGHLNPKALISAEKPGSKAQEAFEILENDPNHHLKIILNISA